MIRVALLVMLVLAVAAHCLGACGERPNLLFGGGFEGGDGSVCGKEKGIGRGWEAICGGPHPEIYALDSTVKHSGKYSQRMTCENYGYHRLEGGGYCYHTEDGREVRHPVDGVMLSLQAIAQTTRPGVIVPGREYSCGVWVKIDGLTSKWEWFRLCIYWLDADRKFISETREDEKSGKANYGTHDWRCVKLTAKAPERAAFAKVYLHHHFEHGVVWYDDAWLTEAGGDE